MAGFYLYTCPMLNILFPGLAQADAHLDLLGAARLPKLDRLLARSRRESLLPTDLESLLCAQLGIARQRDWPIAAISLARSGAHAGNHCWLRADPVHVRVERDRLVLNELHDPDPHELEQLRTALAAHFGDSFSPRALRADAWVVQIRGELEITTTPLSQAAGRPIDPLLPAGPDALAWRTLLNEAQMLLFSHPVNQAREARGEPPINSVWLWGGGRLPEPGAKNSLSILCDQPDLRALCEYAGARVGPVPARWPSGLPRDVWVVFDAPHRHLCRGEVDAWLRAMQCFELDWLAPLLGSGRPFRLIDPLQGVQFEWRGWYRWKFWRRPQKPRKPGFKLEQPAADPGIDAFGNRY